MGTVNVPLLDLWPDEDFLEFEPWDEFLVPSYSESLFCVVFYWSGLR